jgi:predicted ferric reductase
MLNLIWLIAIVLVVLWAVGLATSYTMGGMLHILLVLAVVVIIARLVMGRRRT